MMQLISILANRHIVGGQVNGGPVRLLLHFTQGHPLRIGVSGEHLIIDNGQLDEPYDMGKYGQIDVADITQAAFSGLAGAELKSIRTLTWRGIQVGLSLEMETGATFHFWADGDELFWGDHGALTRHQWLGGDTPEAGTHIKLQ